MLDTLSSEELVFIKAIDKYKVENDKSFLSWTEVLKIVKDLGYHRVIPSATQSDGETADKAEAE